MHQVARMTIILLAFVATLVSATVAGAGPKYYLSDNPPLEPVKRGVVITVHGGGWEGNYGAAADTLMAQYVGAYQRWGYRVYNLGHRPRRLSLVDTIDAVERVSRKHPRRPLCLFGGSSGGHLVLMAAIERPELVDCVIDQAGTPDLINPDTAPGWQKIHDAAVKYWGRRGVRQVSPMQRAKELVAPVLVIAPECDFGTSIARQERFVRKLKRGRLLRQYAGPGYNTGHCELTWESILAGVAAQHEFLDRHAG